MKITDKKIDADRRAFIASQMQYLGVPFDRDGVATIVSLIPDCDVCKFEDRIYGVKAVADVRTRTGQWGNVCESHLRSHAISLGYGFGQMFVLATPRTEVSVNPDSIGAGYPEEGI